jgi:hypothetical protein
MPQGHFARAGAGAGVNGLARNKPEAYNPGKEKTAHENVYGRGWRYCAPTIDNVGMPGRVKGRPPGGGMRLHPNVDSTTPFPPGEGTSGGPIQDSGRTGPTKRRPALRDGAPRAKIAEALRRASGDGDLDAVETYLEDYAEYIDDRNDWNGRTALIECAHCPGGSDRHLKTLRKLIAKGSELDVQDKHGVTAIHAFAQRGFTMAVHALMVAKADVNLAASDGTTPLMAAAAAGKREVVETLLAGEAPPPRWRDNDGPFQTAEIDAVDKLGRTAAVFAAQHGQQKCLHLLAAKGADLEARDRLEGSTVCVIAVSVHLIACHRVLLLFIAYRYAGCCPCAVFTTRVRKAG